MSGVENPQHLTSITAPAALALFSNPSVELENVRVTGEVDLRSAHVSGPVRIHNCVFEGAVDATDARFDRSVQFTNCEFEKGLSLAHARINGPLDLSGSVLKPANGAVHMLFRDLHVEGCIEGTRLRVECGLNFSDLECGAAFRLHGANVKGDLLLNSAYLEGELDLGDCEAYGSNPAARTDITEVLNADCAHIESRVLLVGTKLGSARFEQAQIEGTMLLSPGRHTSTQVELGVATEAGKPPDGCSLSLLGATLEGSLELRGAKLHGSLRVSNAKVGCYLTIDRGEILGQEVPTSLGASRRGAALRVTSTCVQGAMTLGRVEFAGSINASNSDIALVEIDKECVKNLKSLFSRLLSDYPNGVLDLEGLKFGRLSLLEKRKAVDAAAFDYLELLSLTKFNEGTYASVEGWLRLNAKDDDADEIFREMRKMEKAQRRKRWERFPLRSKLSLWPKRIFLSPIGFFFGYGTRSLPGCVLWLATFAFSWCLFSGASALEETEKADPATISKTPGRWDRFDVVLRIHLPIIPWFSDPVWKPATNIIPRPSGLNPRVPWPEVRYDTLATALLILNVANVTLIIASLSGLLKRRGS